MDSSRTLSYDRKLSPKAHSHNIFFNRLFLILKMAKIECKTYSINTDIPRRVYQASAIYNLFVEATKVLKPLGRALIKLDFSMVIPDCEP